MLAKYKLVSCLYFLDITAAFNTVDHAILTKHISSVFGIPGTALSWVKSHLSPRSFNVNAAGHTYVAYVYNAHMYHPQTLTRPHLVFLMILFLSVFFSSFFTPSHWAYSFLYSLSINISTLTKHNYNCSLLSFSPHSLQDALNLI